MSTPNTTQKCSPITGKKEEDASGGDGILCFGRRGLCGGMPPRCRCRRRNAADSLAYLIDFFGQFRVAFELLHLLAFHFQRSCPNPRCSTDWICCSPPFMTAVS